MPASLLSRNPNLKWALVVLGLFVLWMMTGLFPGGEKAETSSEVRPQESMLPQVSITEVAPKPYTLMLNLPAQTAARYKASLTAQTDGRVSVLKVENGMRVTKGQELLTLDAAARRAELASAKAALASAVKLETSARTLAADGFMSQTELAEREASAAAARAQVKTIQQDLAYTHIKAPIDGVVENRAVSVGDVASMGTPLMDIVNREDLLLTANLPQKDRARVQLGQEVRATLITGEEIVGLVDFIATDANSSSRTFRIDMAVDGTRFNMPTGMSADVHIPAEEVSAYAIPHSAAMLNTRGDLGVMVLENGVARFKKIESLEDSPEELLVSGLTGTVQLITGGHLALTDGAQVETK